MNNKFFELNEQIQELGGQILKLEQIIKDIKSTQLCHDFYMSQASYGRSGWLPLLCKNCNYIGDGNDCESCPNNLS